MDSPTNLQSILEKCTEEIFEELGSGFKESVYQNIIAHELRKLGMNVSKEINVPIIWHGVEVGNTRLDLIVEEKNGQKSIIEFKTISKIGEREENQLERYLKLYPCDEGFLINFSLDKYELVSKIFI